MTYFTRLFHLDFLDEFIDWELLLDIFSKTQDGDYAALTRQQSLSRSNLLQSFSDTTVSRKPFTMSLASASTSISSSSTMFEMPGSSGSSRNTPPHSELDHHLSKGSYSVSPMLNTNWLRPLFADIYIEQGLVLETQATMEFSQALISATAFAAFSGKLNSDQLTVRKDTSQPQIRNAKGKGKSSDASKSTTSSTPSSDPRERVISSARNLGILLTKYRHYTLAGRVLIRAFGSLLENTICTNNVTLENSGSEAEEEKLSRLKYGGVTIEEAKSLSDLKNSDLLQRSLNKVSLQCNDLQYSCTCYILASI